MYIFKQYLYKCIIIIDITVLLKRLHGSPQTAFCSFNIKINDQLIICDKNIP